MKPSEQLLLDLGIFGVPVADDYADMVLDLGDERDDGEEWIPEDDQ